MGERTTQCHMHTPKWCNTVRTASSSSKQVYSSKHVHLSLKSCTLAYNPPLIPLWMNMSSRTKSSVVSRCLMKGIKFIKSPLLFLSSSVLGLVENTDVFTLFGLGAMLLDVTTSLSFWTEQDTIAYMFLASNPVPIIDILRT